MADLTTREQLKDYCLRALGSPVIEINLDTDQIDDRIDEAIQKFNRRHFDGYQKYYVKHTVDQTDYDNQYILVPDNTTTVQRVFNFKSQRTGLGDIRYQTLLNEMYNVSSFDLVHYDITKSYFSLLEQILAPEPGIRFKYTENKLYIDTDWTYYLKPGTVVVIELVKKLDPETHTRIYNDSWLKKYSTALLKKQWGTNLKKYSGIQLLGGVTLDGQTIYNEAVEEIKELENDLNNEYEMPPDFFTG